MIVVKSPGRTSATKGEPSLAARQVNRAALCLSLVAGILLWASFPPLNLGPLAFFAPVPWLVLARLPRTFSRGTYGAIWLGGFVHWLAMLQGIRLAHWALVFGWIVLAAYVACYVPLLVWLCRVAVLRLRVPLVVAAPIVWVGLELVRGYFATGFSAGLLGHTQTYWPALLQVADVFGAYGVSFLVAVVAATMAQLLPSRWTGASDERSWRSSLWQLVPAAACIAAAVFYGHFRLNQTPPRAAESPLRVALIQGSLDTVFDASQKEHDERVDRTFRQYGELTAEASQKPGKLDLVIWPESMFATVEPLVHEPLHVPAGVKISVELMRERLGESQRAFDQIVREATVALNPESLSSGDAAGTSFLFGTTTLEYGPHEPKQFNAALLANAQGKIVARYYKVHPVMFGEYIPFGEWFPIVYKVTPLPGGLDRGPGPVAMEVAGKRLSPCICFENVVPHLVRNQVIDLSRRGTPPDVLVTVTNDGWFYGSSILDLHFRCAIFRAIENRRPMLIAANTGFSAHIDGSGNVLAKGPRRAKEVLIVNAQPDGRMPLYHTLGDWPATICAAACGILAIAGLSRRNGGKPAAE